MKSTFRMNCYGSGIYNMHVLCHSPNMAVDVPGRKTLQSTDNMTWLNHQVFHWKAGCFQSRSSI